MPGIQTSQCEVWWMNEWSLQVTEVSLPLSCLLDDTAEPDLSVSFLSTHPSLQKAFIEHLQYVRQPARISWSRMNQTVLRLLSPFPLVPSVRESPWFYPTLFIFFLFSTIFDLSLLFLSLPLFGNPCWCDFLLHRSLFIFCSPLMILSHTSWGGNPKETYWISDGVAVDSFFFNMLIGLEQELDSVWQGGHLWPGSVS